jgi:hypothetical protein
MLRKSRTVSLGQSSGMPEFEVATAMAEHAPRGAVALFNLLNPAVGCIDLRELIAPWRKADQPG